MRILGAVGRSSYDPRTAFLRPRACKSSLTIVRAKSNPTRIGVKPLINGGLSSNAKVSTDVFDRYNHTLQSNVEVEFPSVASVRILWESPKKKTKITPLGSTDVTENQPHTGNAIFQHIHQRPEEEKVNEETRRSDQTAVIHSTEEKPREAKRLRTRRNLRKSGQGLQEEKSEKKVEEMLSKSSEKRTKEEAPKPWRSTLNRLKKRNASVNLSFRIRKFEEAKTPTAQAIRSVVSATKRCEQKKTTKEIPTPKITAPKILKSIGSSKVLLSPASAETFDKDQDDEKKLEEREYTIRFADKATFEIFDIPKLSPDDFEIFFYDEDEIAEFRYEAFCESIETNETCFFMK